MSDKEIDDVMMHALNCYHGGDYSAAVPLFESAAEKGNTNALTYLGHCYYNGYGVEQNKKAGMLCYSTAAEKGDPEAFVSLGNIFIENDEEEKAFYCFKKGAEIGSADAVFNLALIYYSGLKTVPHDYEKAAEYFTFLIDNGIEDHCVIHLLGRCMALMDNPDLKKALELFEKAASLGNEQAAKDRDTLLFGGQIIETPY